MEKVSALLNSLDLGGQDSSSAPGVDSTILDLITNQRWFRDAVFTAGYLSDVDIGRARATASVVDRLCAPRALRVVACAGLRGLAQTEGLPAIGTAVAVYEDGGDAAALIKTVLNAVVRSSAREKYTAVDLRVVSKLALACPRAVADAVTFVDAFAAGVSPVSSVDFQIQAWGPNVCCDVSRRPLDLQALFIAAALRAPYRSYAGNIRHTALARIAELVQDDNEDLNAAGYAALLRAGLFGDLLERVAYGSDAQDEVGDGHQMAFHAATNIMEMVARFKVTQCQRAERWAQRNCVSSHLHPGPIGVITRFVQHYGAGNLVALCDQRGLEDAGQAELWRDGLLVTLEAANFAALSSADIAAAAACSLAVIEDITSGDPRRTSETTMDFLKIQLLLVVLCESLLRFGPRAYARQLRQEHPSAIRAFLRAHQRRNRVHGEASPKIKQWACRPFCEDMDRRYYDQDDRDY